MDLRNEGTIGRWLMGSDFRAKGGKGRLGELVPEGGDRGEDPDEGDEEADAGSGDALGVGGSRVVAEEGAEGEDARFWPIDEATGDEPGGGDEIEEGAEDIFEGVHLVDGAEAKEAKGGEHEDADAGAEITAINGEGKLAGDGENERGSFEGLGWRWGAEFLEEALDEKEGGGEEDQPGDETGKGCGIVLGEERAAEESSREADGNEAEEVRADGGDLLAEAEDTPGGADD